MSARKKNYEVGKGKPPKGTRFTKGRSGNPRGRPKTPPRTLADIIEKLWMMIAPITENGIPRNAPALEIILLQLLAKVRKGNRRALRVLHKYEEFAKTKPRIRIVKIESSAEMADRYAKLLAYGE